MPDQEEVVVDTPVDDAAHDTTVTDDSAPDNKETAPVKLYFGKWKSEEEATKGVEEYNKLLARQADELGKLRSERELLSRQSKLEDAISTLAENSKAKKEEPIVDFEEFVQTVSDKWQDEPKEAIKKLTGLYNGWLSQSDNKHRTELEETKKSFEEKLSKVIEIQERLDPDYQQNRELIDKMIAKGVSLSVAKSIVKDFGGSQDNSSATSTRTLPPVTVNPTRATVRETEPASDLFITEKDVEILRLDFPDYTDEQLKNKAKEMNADRKARIKSGQPIRNGVYERRGI